VEEGCFPSRERARAAVLAGCVRVDGETEYKPGRQVAEASHVIVSSDSLAYVSRGALKIEAALERLSVDVKGKVCLDVGASTGGFTQVLLDRGAALVYAVDVGYGQLAYKLRQDPRVVVMERTNARYLNPGDFPYPPSIATMDVSFISAAKVLPAIMAVTTQGAEVLLLVKPQFEVERGGSKKGVVRDPQVHLEVLAKLEHQAQTLGLFLAGAVVSPILGPKGNIEFWFHLVKGFPGREVNLENMVNQAHDALRGGGT
jgi:23S rRNA (cytidine1920-2'-O)/16S rRNA (cytidine1409-2'-O)-methyltransferase